MMRTARRPIAWPDLRRSWGWSICAAPCVKLRYRRRTKNLRLPGWRTSGPEQKLTCKRILPILSRFEWLCARGLKNGTNIKGKDLAVPLSVSDAPVASTVCQKPVSAPPRFPVKGRQQSLLSDRHLPTMNLATTQTPAQRTAVGKRTILATRSPSSSGVR